MTTPYATLTVSRTYQEDQRSPVQWFLTLAIEPQAVSHILSICFQTLETQRPSATSPCGAHYGPSSTRGFSASIKVCKPEWDKHGNTLSFRIPVDKTVRFHFVFSLQPAICSAEVSCQELRCRRIWTILGTKTHPAPNTITLGPSKTQLATGTEWKEKEAVFSLITDLIYPKTGPKTQAVASTGLSLQPDFRTPPHPEVLPTTKQYYYK